MSIRLSFRRAAERDVPALARLEERCFRGKAYDGARYAAQDIRDALKDPQRRLVVAMFEKSSRRKSGDQKALAGYAILSFAGKAAALDGLAVDPVFQGRGIGRALLEQSEKQACKAGYSMVTLEVHQDNGKAIALYTAKGYVSAGGRQKRYADGGLVVRMRKNL